MKEGIAIASAGAGALTCDSAAPRRLAPDVNANIAGARPAADCRRLTR
jgi:hypothetical protein